MFCFVVRFFLALLALIFTIVDSYGPQIRMSFTPLNPLLPLLDAYFPSLTYGVEWIGARILIPERILGLVFMLFHVSVSFSLARMRVTLPVGMHIRPFGVGVRVCPRVYRCVLFLLLHVAHTHTHTLVCVSSSPYSRTLGLWGYGAHGQAMASCKTNNARHILRKQQKGRERNRVPNPEP